MFFSLNVTEQTDISNKRVHQNKCVDKQQPQEDEDDGLKSDSNMRDNLKGQYPFQQMYKLLKLN